MLTEIALITMAHLFAPSTNGDGLLIGIDKDLQTTARLSETDDSIVFELTGPESIAPTIGVDVNRNGAVDRNLDFQVSFKPGGNPCLAYLIDESSSTTCNLPGEKTTIEQAIRDQMMVTTFSFPKRQISGDGFGFGFSIRLWSMTDHYGVVLASGDYRFGGKLSLVGEGPNFQGDSKPSTSPMLSALRGYQGCVNKELDALAPLKSSVAPKVRALPTTCAMARSAAWDRGINALVATGISMDEATQMVRSSVEAYESEIGLMAERLERGGK